MRIESIVNLRFLSSHIVMHILAVLAVAGVAATNYLVFMVVPNEAVMGAVQRIFYFHVGSVMAAYTMIALLFTASCFVLVTRKPEWDIAAESAAAVAFLFSSVVLASGMIWG